MERQTRLSNDFFKALGEFKAVSTLSSGFTKVPRYMIDRCQKCLSEQAPFSDNKKYSSYGISNLLHYSHLDLIKNVNQTLNSAKSDTRNQSNLTNKVGNIILLKALNRRFNSIQYHKGQIMAIRKILEEKKCEMIFVTLYKCGLDGLIYKMILGLFGITDPHIITVQELEQSDYLCKSDALLHLVPIASSYDIIPNIPSTSDSLPIASTSLKLILSAVQNYGSMRINILQPIPVKNFLQSITERISSSFETDLSPTKSVLNHLTFDLLHGTTIMSTQLVAFVLLTRYRQGASVEQLKQSCEWLIDELYTRNINVGFCGDCKYVIQYACKLLTKDLVSVKTRIGQDASSGTDDVKFEKYLMPSTSYPRVLDLKRHASHLSNVFILDSVIAISLVSILSKQSQHILFSSMLETRIRVQRKLLIAGALNLCKLLSPQYVFNQPCYSIDEMIELRIELMVNRGYLIADDPPPFMRNQDHYGFYDSDDDDDYFRADDPRFFQYIIVKQKRYAYRAIQMFYHILSPIVDSYLIAGQSLRRLLDNHLTMSDLLKSANDLASSLIRSNYFKYEESINDDYFKHAFNKYLEYGATTIDEKTSLIKLTNRYNSEEAIEHLMKTVNLAKYKLSI